jgi:hypothetical protein
MIKEGTMPELAFFGSPSAPRADGLTRSGFKGRFRGAAKIRNDYSRAYRSLLNARILMDLDPPTLHHAIRSRGSRSHVFH